MRWSIRKKKPDGDMGWVSGIALGRWVGKEQLVADNDDCQTLNNEEKGKKLQRCFCTS